MTCELILAMYRKRLICLPELFDMNVRYGAASGQVLSVEDVENACHLAKADEFINRSRRCYQYDRFL